MLSFSANRLYNDPLILQPAVEGEMNDYEEVEEHLDFIESFQDFRREERIALTKFIEAYEALPCLWNRRDKTFTNRMIKKQAYKQLAAVSRKINPNAGNVNWVKSKITGLRAVFFRDYKKVVESIRTGGEIYSPKLWYFGLMLFVTEVDDEHLALNEKIRCDLNLKTAADFTMDSDIEISGLITEKEKTEYRAGMTDFIRIYKANSCLWNFHNKDKYHNKELRARAHNQLVNSARQFFPGVDLEWVKAKIYKLRAVFWREHKKREKAAAAGTEHRPALWYYDQMLFLTKGELENIGDRSYDANGDITGEDPLIAPDECEEVPLKYNYAEEDCLDDFDLSQATLDSADPAWDLVESSDDIANDPKTIMNELLMSTDSSSAAGIGDGLKGSKRKRKKTDADDSEPVMIHLPELSETFPMDELTAFATSTSSKLRRMTQEQRDLAELEIGRILFLGLRGRLVDNTILPPVAEPDYPDCTI